MGLSTAVGEPDQQGRAVPVSDIAVVVPVGGAAPAWPRAAASLAGLSPPPAEIVVVVDGPAPAHVATATSIGARVIELPERGGPARARNRGVEATSRPVVLFLDADVEVPAGLVADVSATFGQHPEIAAVMGSYDAAPAAPGVVSQYRNLLHHFVHQTARERASTFWAGCGAIRRGPFAAVGGFDERFTEPSIEDIDLGVRLVHAGHAIRLEKSLQVRHLKRWTLRDMVATDLWRRAVPWTVLMLRGGRLVNDLNVKTADRVGVAAAGAALAALAGVWWSPLWLAASAAALAITVAANAAFFGFLLRRRGPWFALRALPVHWLFLLVCGAGFALGVTQMGRMPGRRER